MKQYRIKSLRAENVLRLKAVEISVPDGAPMVTVGGKNGQGKTSVLRAIELALAGKDSFPDEPVRRGEEKATIVLDLGEIIVERVIRASGTTQLVVKNKDGARYERPQELLSALQTKLSFDPMEFVRTPPKQQRETLRALVGLDFSGIDKDRAEAFSLRTEANRDAERYAVEAKCIVVPDGTPDVAPDMAEISARYREANAQEKERGRLELEISRANGDLERWPSLKEQMQEEVKALELKIAEVKSRIARGDESAKEVAKAVLKLDEQRKAIPAVNLAEIEAEGKRLRDVESAVERKKTHAERQAKAEAAKHAAANLTQAIEKFDAQKADMLAKAAFPVAGLAFSDKGVTFNGIPFEQASSAEQIRVSVAMGRALNPSIRIMLVRNGSLLDKDSMALLAEEAEKNGLQVWVEVVDDGDEPRVIIEDGEVKANRFESRPAPTPSSEEVHA